MSTTDVGRVRAAAEPRPRDAAASHTNLTGAISAALAPLASLRLTVVLFALSIFLVLAGTVAQRYHDIWYVVHEYFRTGIAWIELRAFFPASLDVSPELKLPFPGGWLIGGLLAMNLVAAHALRFKIAARGWRLVLGVALLAAGVGVTYAVVQSGLDDAVESELSPQFCNGLWHALRAALGAAALTACYFVATLYPKSQKSSEQWVWRLSAAGAALLLAAAVFLFVNPEARLDASGLRILWQLIKATAASVVLWLGCWLVFAKRSGIVLLHLGVALMMFSELLTGQYAVESSMRIYEGQTVDYAQDMRKFELAVVDKSDPSIDRTTIVPGSMVTAAAQSNEPIRLESLPFDLRVEQFMRNSDVRLVQPGEEPSATRGRGQMRKAIPLAGGTGVDQEQAIDVPTATVELLAKDDESLDTLLLSPLLSMNGGPDVVNTEEGVFELELRFKRIDKPYSVTLIDFIKEDYVGSDTPKHYESVLRIQEPERDVDLTLGAWMNNPVRYRGDTLYQSGFDPRNEQYTDLQVVSNAGWMIPYVACMIVATGMLVQFGSSLLRFVRRREEENQRRRAQQLDPAGADTDDRLLANWRRPAVFVPAGIVALFAGYVLSRSVPPRESAAQMHVRAAGELPVAFAGRTQPWDSLARNTLRFISGKETFEDGNEDRQPAMRWMMDLLSESGDWQRHRVVRIENLEVLQLLDLQRRKGYRYSFAEVLGDQDQVAEIERQFTAAHRAEAAGEPLTLIQRKLIELDLKLRRIMALKQAFETPPLEQMTSREDFEQIQMQIARLNSSSIVPRPAPPIDPEGTWKTVYEATLDALRDSMQDPANRDQHESTVQLIQLISAYRQGDVQQFNKAVAEYQSSIEEIAQAEAEYEAGLEAAGQRGGRKTAERLWPDRIRFEAYFNYLNPILLCKIFYIAAFVLAAAAFLGWPEGFNRSANWLLWATFALHSFALLCRIYISGRPPVTNLYSSAVFIGWGAVLFALLFEMINGLGVGNLLGAAIGFPSMMIAQSLMTDGSGDTFGVMQAVLDTNFWLATHVVCISLGYVTTFLAGAFGLATILIGRILGLLDDEQRKQLSKMTYGAVCFAMFFSFVGTVLGGLWADDSWGRFWGWDPKENGALMIVLWNALALHARWGKMVGDRGFAVLAIFGNVVTAWSWFGVNQLGIGLHSYGFSDGLTKTLVLFAASQLVVMALAAVPARRRARAASA